MWPHLLRACALPEFRMCSSEACARLGSPARPPQAQKTHGATQLGARLFLNSQVPGPGPPPSALHPPPARRLTSHNTTFTQPNSFCGFLSLSKYLGTKVRMFSWHGQTHSIMTFSEIGPGSLKCNAFDRCFSLQLHKSRYTECEAALSESRVLWFFRAKLLGNIRFYQLSLPQRRYLNISQHEHTCRAESVSGEHMLLPN